MKSLDIAVGFPMLFCIFTLTPNPPPLSSSQIITCPTCELLSAKPDWGQKQGPDKYHVVCENPECRTGPSFLPLYRCYAVGSRGRGVWLMDCVSPSFLPPCICCCVFCLDSRLEVYHHLTTVDDR